MNAMNKKQFIAIALIVLIAGLALSACGPKKAELTVELKDFAFVPDSFSAPAGGEVTINMSNSGTLEHEFVIVKKGEQITAPFSPEDEDKIYWEHELDAGAAETITFTAPSEPGDYQVVCGLAGHLEQGMEGTLTVK